MSGETTERVTFEERAYRSHYNRKAGHARAAIARMQATLGLVLADLDAGRVPTYGVSADAVQLAMDIAALDALAEMKQVYDSAATGRETGQ